jgi:hypothetical protein
MKKIACVLFALNLLLSCHPDNPILVNQAYVDSLITHYSIPAHIVANESEMEFWKLRIDPKHPGLVNEQKYAGTLLQRFVSFGDVHDLKKADSIVTAIDRRYLRTDGAVSLLKASLSISGHRFKEAKEDLSQAMASGAKKYSLLMTSFDVYLELGQYDSAARALYAIRGNKDYNYFYRLSKWEHIHGETDSALSSMLTAAVYAEQDPFLKQVALSNAGDLCVHSGHLEKAAEFYESCIQLNPADFHSMIGLGWIAMIHDKNDMLAKKIFSFVQEKSKKPDVLLKLSQLAGSGGDHALQKKYALEFSRKVSDSAYGNMYNKYLIDLYTGILNDPAKAEALASKELFNRATPQTYAWYAFALISNKKPEEAYAVFRDHVSGKPLESQELYWMGRLMKQLNKNYNADQFFEAALQNKYDFPRDVLKTIVKN